MVLCEPAVSLRRYVHGGYCGWTECTSAPERRRELPAGFIPVILNLGPPFGVSAPGEEPSRLAHFDSFVAGMHDRFVLTESAGVSHCIQLNLSPIAAHLVFGLAMHELTNRTVALDDLLGNESRRLIARLHDAQSWDARFTILDAFLTARLAVARHASAEVEWAWRALQQSSGRLEIGALATEIGWSRKHLAHCFREQIGLPPKLVARVMRFHVVIDRVRREMTSTRSALRLPRWSELALDAGYYDQAHLVRDFVEFAGASPSEFVRLHLATVPLAES
jgi:AraC-like DNA-binding protein